MALSQRELAVAKLLQKEAGSATRFLDMRLGVELADGERLITVGGQWDRVEHQFDGQGAEEVVVTLHEGQARAGLWLKEWLARHVEAHSLRGQGLTADDAVTMAWGDELAIFSVVFHGGRRGGKSHLAMVAGGLMTVLVPGARCVCVSPQLKDTLELQLILEEQLLPAPWRQWDSKESRYELANGSTIEMITGRRSNLKIGRVDLAVYNEAQEMAETGFLDLMACAADSGGLAIACCNPPRRPIGRWVQTYHDEVNDSASGHQAEGEGRVGKTFFFDPERNPHVVRRVLRNLATHMDEKTYRREVLGDMSVPIGDVVFHAYSNTGNLRSALPSDWVDVTEKMTAERFERPAKRVGGLDFDARPGCTWSAGRFFSPDGSLALAKYWIEYSLLIEGGDEHALHDSMRSRLDDRGEPLFDPEWVVLVGDASGRWQNTQRDHQDPNRLYSFEILESYGWFVIRPDPELKSNPPFDKRIALGNASLCSHDGTRRVLIHPRAIEIVESCREYPIKNGRPYRRSRHAHPGDTWTYVVWRAWGREHEHTVALAAYQGMPRQERSLSKDW